VRSARDPQSCRLFPKDKVPARSSSARGLGGLSEFAQEPRAALLASGPRSAYAKETRTTILHGCASTVRSAFLTCGELPLRGLHFDPTTAALPALTTINTRLIVL
jgi:hypothetical protein